MHCHSRAALPSEAEAGRLSAVPTASANSVSPSLFARLMLYLTFVESTYISTVMNNEENHVGLYARVSTLKKGQDPELQLRPLRDYAKARGWTVQGEYIDKGISGNTAKRPELERLLDDAKKRKLDIILIWKIDRLWRNCRYLINTIEDLQACGVMLISYTENIDFTSTAGKLVLTVLGWVTEMELEDTRERVIAGMDLARSKGKQIGRSRIPPITLKQVLEFKGKEMSVRKIARKVGISVGMVQKVINAMKAGEISEEGHWQNR